MRSRDFTRAAGATNFTAGSNGGVMKRDDGAARWGRPGQWNVAREWCADLLRIAAALTILALLAAMDGGVGVS
jgi:hypothetical protein